MWQTCSTEAAFRGGLHVDLPKGEWLDSARLQPLVDSGAIAESEIDVRVRRMLLVRQRFQLMGPSVPDYTIPENRAESR